MKFTEAVCIQHFQPYMMEHFYIELIILYTLSSSKSKLFYYTKTLDALRVRKGFGRKYNCKSSAWNLILRMQLREKLK